jgi:PAS domain-containing protein
MVLRALSNPNPLAVRIRVVSAESVPACLVDADGTILFVNEAWERAAREEAGGAGCMTEALVGKSWFDQISGEAPHREHEILFELALQRRGAGPGGHVVQVSENNSPSTARLIATHFEPIISPAREILGLVITHRIVRERPMAEVYAVVSRPESEYRREDGTIRQCSCCRRTLRADGSEEWEFVPDLLARPAGVTEYLFCPLCRELHYPLPEE